MTQIKPVFLIGVFALLLAVSFGSLKSIIFAGRNIVEFDFGSQIPKSWKQDIGGNSSANIKEIKFISILNDPPTQRESESFEFIFKAFVQKIDFFAIARKNNRANPIANASKFIFSKIIQEGIYQGVSLGSSYYLIVRGWRIYFAEREIDPKITGKMIIRLLNGERPNPIISKAGMENLIVAGFLRKDFHLWNILSKENTRLDASILHSRVYFFHSDCSSCLIEKTLNSPKFIDESETKDNTIFLFPFLTIPDDLNRTIRDRAVLVRTYIDLDDLLGVGFADMNFKENPLIVDLRMGRSY